MATKYPRGRKPTGDFVVGNTGPDISKVESPVAGYGAPAPLVVEVFDHWISVLQNLGVKTSAAAGSTLAQIREALRQGMPRDAFESLRDDLGVSTEEFAEILGIPTRTLARRTDRFKPDESERLLRVGSVVQKALDVLEDKESARRWMTQPKRALGGLTPLRCCDTEIGAREVEALLGRIEHGVFS
ncbi:MAG: antitoxin Xre/MbcA/ParS toxin-binding domain-containing protein [Luteolibacter sp.]|uniref:type II RES/Xre toxin-antitoxin system antitoxin n=1 Tax=Luteolibacter sp. TaxID=1962973 RepID=UPI0032632A2F